MSRFKEARSADVEVAHPDAIGIFGSKNVDAIEFFLMEARGADLEVAYPSENCVLVSPN